MKVMINLDEKLLKELDDLCDINYKSRSGFISDLIVNFIKYDKISYIMSSQCDLESIDDVREFLKEI